MQSTVSQESLSPIFYVPQIVLLSYIMNVSTHTMYILSNATKHLSQLPWSKPPTSPLLGSQKPQFPQLPGHLFINQTKNMQQTLDPWGNGWKWLLTRNILRCFLWSQWLNPQKQPLGHFGWWVCWFVVFPRGLSTLEEFSNMISNLVGSMAMTYQDIPTWRQFQHVTTIYIYIYILFGSISSNRFGLYPNHLLTKHPSQNPLSSQGRNHNCCFFYSS